MPNAFARAATAAALAAIVLCAACSSQQDVIQQQKEKLESLGATTQLIAEDWLAGKLPGTYTQTALEQTYAQVEQQRTTLAAKPQTLLDERAARLSQQAEQLSRLIAAMMHDVSDADAEAVRRRIAAIPIVPAQP